MGRSESLPALIVLAVLVALPVLLLLLVLGVVVVLVAGGVAAPGARQTVQQIPTQWGVAQAEPPAEQVRLLRVDGREGVQPPMERTS